MGPLGSWWAWADYAKWFPMLAVDNRAEPYARYCSNPITETAPVLAGVDLPGTGNDRSQHLSPVWIAIQPRTRS
jgi:hypothetical protein